MDALTFRQHNLTRSQVVSNTFQRPVAARSRITRTIATHIMRHLKNRVLRRRAHAQRIEQAQQLQTLASPAGTARHKAPQRSDPMRAKHKIIKGFDLRERFCEKVPLSPCITGSRAAIPIGGDVAEWSKALPC